MSSAGGVLISLTYMPWSRRWINHSSLWRMASVTPYLRLPSQSQDIAAPWLIPNYAAWWQRHMCVNNLPKVVAWQRNGRELNSRPLESQANALTITPPGHTTSRTVSICQENNCHNRYRYKSRTYTLNRKSTEYRRDNQLLYQVTALLCNPK